MRCSGGLSATEALDKYIAAGRREPNPQVEIPLLLLPSSKLSVLRVIWACRITHQFHCLFPFIQSFTIWPCVLMTLP